MKISTPNILFDEWTASSNKRYLNVIARFGEEEFNLGLVEVRGSATGENISLLLKNKLNDFGIDLEKIKFITADGAAVNKKVAKLKKLKIQLCFNHAIHLAVCDILYSKGIADEKIESDDECPENDSLTDENDEIPFSEIAPEIPHLNESSFANAVMKLRKLVATFRRSPSLESTLSETASTNLQIDVKTRWNSLIIMIKSFLKIQVEVKLALVKHQMEELFPSKDDIAVLKSSVALLKLISNAVVMLSERNCNLITADFIFTKLFNELENELPSQLRDALIGALDRRIKQRRTKYSDILFFLNERHFGIFENRFYSPPNMEDLKEFIPINTENVQIVQEEKRTFYTFCSTI